MCGKWLKTLILASACYLVSASLGAALAITMHLPARFGGILHGDDVARDFLLVNGTALSPDLALLLGQVVLTACALRTGRAGMVGVIGLTALGVAYLVGQLGEPIARQAFAPSSFNAAQAALVTANVIFPTLMAAFGALEWRGTQLAGREVGVQSQISRTNGMPRAGGQP